jgi:hypothetical protein
MRLSNENTQVRPHVHLFQAPIFFDTASSCFTALVDCYINTTISRSEVKPLHTCIRKKCVQKRFVNCKIVGHFDPKKVY